MTREELEKTYVDLAYASITNDTSRMTKYVWDTLNIDAEEMSEKDLRDMIEMYSDEEEIL